MGARTIQVQTATTTTTTHNNRISLSGEQIIDLLRAAGHDVPECAEVVFRVPGGGDWSGTEVDVGADCPVVVWWKTQERS